MYSDYPGEICFYDSLYDAPEIKTVLVREESSDLHWKGT
jgi:hypothetical protein